MPHAIWQMLTKQERFAPARPARLTARAGASYESAEHGIAASFGRT